LIYRIALQKKEILILFAALLFSFSYATSPFSFCIYIAFIPLLRNLELSKSHQEAFGIGYKVGLIVNALVFYWITYYKFNSYLLIVILNPIQFAIFSYLYSYLKIFTHKTRILIFPFLWTFLEYSREFGDLALNWLNIGYTQGNFLTLIQFADITGLNGIVFWICLINVIIYNLIYKIFRFKLVSANLILLLLLFLLPLFYGHLKMTKKKIKNGISAAYIQPNVSSKYKWDSTQLEENVNILIKDSEQLSVDPFSLLIWPETALPNSKQNLILEIDQVMQYTNERNTHILTGILYDSSYKQMYSRYNSALLISFGNYTDQIYHKIKLVPVEEVLPYYELIDYIIPDKYLVNFYGKGREKTIFEANLQLFETDSITQKFKLIGNHGIIRPVRFSAVICFESSFPSFIREFILNGAELIIVITNDEWFGYSIQSIQHLITSRFRAIENRSSIIHCSNAGISSFIDHLGRYYGKSDMFTKSASTQKITLKTELSVFSCFGDWIGKLSTIFILITFVLIFYKNKKNKIK
jgi:apolipoprotein N-acyltransferase